MIQKDKRLYEGIERSLSLTKISNQLARSRKTDVGLGHK
jgi:hypothetical protein